MTQATPPFPTLQSPRLRLRKLLREVARWGGQFHDLAQFALLRRDWRPLP